MPLDNLPLQMNMLKWTKKWSLKIKSKVKVFDAYQVSVDDDDEYVSWGSDFDESCSDDGTDSGRPNVDCDGVNGDYDINDDDEEDEEEDDRLTGKCESYSLNGPTDCRQSHQVRARNLGKTGPLHHHGSVTYDNTYEAISETPSNSSYGGSSEDSSTCYYETPPERRRGSCPSDTDKSSSGIGGMNGSTRSNSGDDRSDLSSLHFECSHDHDSDHYRDSHNHHHNPTSHHHHHNHHPDQLSVEVTTEDIMRELHRKKRILLNGCEASSETSSGQCSEPSPKPRIRPKVKPAIPPKPNIAQYNQSKPGSPGNRRKMRRKIVRPTGEPPPPPVPKSPPPISPASSKLSLTDRLDQLTLDDLNEVLGVQLSSEPEDNGVGDECDGASSKTPPATGSTNADNQQSTDNCSNDKDKKQLQSLHNHNLTDNQNQKQEQLSDKMGSINEKISKSTNQSETTDITKSDRVNNHDNQSSSIDEINDIVNAIMDHDDDDEDFGDYETPLNFKESIENSVNHLNTLKTSSTNNSKPIRVTSGHHHHHHHHQCKGLSIVSPSGSTPSPSVSPSGCNRKISRSSSVASGHFPPDFSDCTGISPYPISPPPPFDDNYCCSCRKLMKSVGSTPNLNAIRSSSCRSELSLSHTNNNTTAPLSSSSCSSNSTRNPSNQPSTAFDNNSHNSSTNHHHHHHHHHVHHHNQQSNQPSHLHSHSTSNLSLLTVDRPKLPRSKPDCGPTNSGNNSNANNKSNSYLNNLTSNNNNNNNNLSTGISFKAEIAAKFAEKAALAKKIINSRPPFKPFESIYATGKSFGFSSSSSSSHTKSSSSSISSSSLNINSNNQQNMDKSRSTSNLAQRPLPPLPDDVMPIEKYSWFHGLERDSAANVLENLGTDGSYLVRPSKRAGQSNPLTLSILHHGKVFHLNIRRRSDGLYCLGKEKDKERTFASVPALIRFHQKEPILLTTKGESAGITKLMVTPISSSSTINPSSSSSQLTTS